MTTSSTIRIGVSACLVGHRVRYDGQDASDRFLNRGLARHTEWVPVCPEVGAGLGTPRETLRLVGTKSAHRAIGNKSGQDHTDRLLDFSHAALDLIASQGLSGFVLKSKSPSCGMERVRVYSDGIPAKVGVGVFARVLRERFPRLPMEEEGRLRDPFLRESFLDAVFAYASWQRLEAEGVTPDRLVAFHSDHKYRLMAHSPRHLKLAGRLVARCGAGDIREVSEQYADVFMAGMLTRTSTGRHVNVLRHMAGYLRRAATVTARSLVSEAIDDYAGGVAPRAVPVALLKHNLREHNLSYLARQSYFDPYPKELVAS